MGRPPNQLVRENFIRSDDGDHIKPVGICKHCGWRRVFNSTNMQTHLEGCDQYHEFASSGRSAYELERQVAKAMSDPRSIFNQPRKRKRPVGRQERGESESSVDVQARVERERALEAVLGLVWSTYASTGSAEARPNGALWNLVHAVAPNAVRTSPNSHPKISNLLSWQTVGTMGRNDPAASGTELNSDGGENLYKIPSVLNKTSSRSAD